MWKVAIGIQILFVCLFFETKVLCVVLSWNSLFVNQVDLKLRCLPASASQVPRLKAEPPLTSLAATGVIDSYVVLYIYLPHGLP